MLIMLLLLIYLGYNYSEQLYPKEVWPINKQYNDMSENSVKDYKRKNLSHFHRTQNYRYNSDYLNYGITKNFNPSDRLIIDDEGIPKIKYNEKYFYNPVTVAQYALTQFGKYYHGEKSPHDFIVAVNKLVDLQSSNGSFKYNFEWNYYLLDSNYESGWTSGMAQGQALSAFARAYYLTKDEKYLIAGNKALKYLLIPVEEGGVMDTLGDLDSSLDNYIIFEEYLAEPASYTLNGFMFTLLGLYDWSQTNDADNKIADKYFEKGITTLEKILYLYDVGSFSSYDLGHITYNKSPHLVTRYHSVHIYLLNSLYTITNIKTFDEYRKRWSNYVQ